ncbi:MAG: hypothetical protein KGI98_11915 [Euryarchaeota archaeon]|nr:hypothetical protein [Euryarchaeota archaeon]
MSPGLFSTRKGGVKLTFLSPSDRRYERDPAEDRVLTIEVERVNWSRMELCPWCRTLVWKHSEEALARCEAAFKAEISRRASGPVRVGDSAKWEAFA